MARKGLGKGLDSMIPPKATAMAAKVKEAKESVTKTGETILKINEVEPNRKQPRKFFNEEALQELSGSIKQHGIIQPLILQKVVTAIDNLPMKDRDTKGDLYEYLLSKMSTAGTTGQFRTPRHIIRMMVVLMQPKSEDIIVDPSCGSAGFLVEAGEYNATWY